MYRFYNNTGNRAQQMEGVMDNFDTVQKARMDLIGEIQAIIEYDNHLHSTNDRLARETWKNILSEEMVHVGELLALLDYLDPSQRQFVQEGIDEFTQRRGK